LKQFELAIDDRQSRDSRHAGAAQIGGKTRLRINFVQLVNGASGARCEVEICAIV
jgi:hypothetical protein